MKYFPLVADLISRHTPLSVRDTHGAALGEPSARRFGPRWCLAGILALTALIYLRCLGNAFIYDDLWMIRLNPYLTRWSFLWHSMTRDSWWFKDPNHLPQSSYYRPLPNVWSGLNYQLFGFHPAGWHAAMIALHLLMVWLVYRTVLLLVSEESTALIAALLFAVLPIHAEAVVSASAVSQLLCAIFTLAAFYFFASRAAAPRRNWTLALLFAGCALLSHESAIVFPGLIAIYVFLLEAPAAIPPKPDNSISPDPSPLPSEELSAQPSAASSDAASSSPSVVASDAARSQPAVVSSDAVSSEPATVSSGAVTPEPSAASSDAASSSPSVVVSEAVSADPFVVSNQRVANELILSRIKRAAIAITPFVVETILYFGVRVLVLGSLAYRNGQQIYASPRVFLLTIPWDLLNYAELLLMPWRTGVAHNVSYVPISTAPQFWLVVIGFALLAAGLTLAPAGKRALYWFCALWFLLTLMPEFNLIFGFPFSFVQDRCLYLPSFAWCLFVADVVVTIAAVGGLLRRAAFVATTAIAAAYAIVLFQVQTDWHDDLTFFRNCALRTPQAPLVHRGLGIALIERNHLPEAVHELTLAFQLDPRDSDALFDRGVVEAHLGDYPDAVRDMQRAIELQPRRPARAYVTLANYADAAGRTNLSEAALRVSASLAGGAKLAQLTRAQIALRHGDNQSANRILEDLSHKYPDDAEVWSDLGSVRVASKDYPGALAAYRRLAVLAPDFSAAYFLTAQVLHSMGRDQEALANCRIALKLNPGDPATTALIAQIQPRKS